MRWQPSIREASEVKMVPGITIRPNAHSQKMPIGKYGMRHHMIDTYNIKSSMRLMCTYEKYPLYINTSSGVESVP